MQINSNIKLIRRNGRIGRATSLIGMFMLIGAMIFSFQIKDATMLIWLWGLMILGLILSQIGIYYGNRWGRSPRPDEIIDKSLKGLSRDYSMYHYMGPSSHLLVGPAGIWSILPYSHSGIVTCEKGRWRVRGGGFIQSYLRIFGQESIGRPDRDAETEIASATRFLTSVLPEGSTLPMIRAILLFINPKVELKTENISLPALLPGNLKDFLREMAKEKPINTEAVEKIRKYLPQSHEG